MTTVMVATNSDAIMLIAFTITAWTMVHTNYKCIQVIEAIIEPAVIRKAKSGTELLAIIGADKNIRIITSIYSITVAIAASLTVIAMCVGAASLPTEPIH